MTSEKPSQKFHADDVSLSWLVMLLCGKSASTNQKHYSSLGSNLSSLLLSFPKKSFRVKTSDVDVKCRMFLRQFKSKKAANRCTTENVYFTGICFVFLSYLNTRFCPIDLYGHSRLHHPVYSTSSLWTTVKHRISSSDKHDSRLRW